MLCLCLYCTLPVGGNMGGIPGGIDPGGNPAGGIDPGGPGKPINHKCT